MIMSFFIDKRTDLFLLIAAFKFHQRILWYSLSRDGMDAQLNINIMQVYIALFLSATPDLKIENYVAS